MIIGKGARNELIKRNVSLALSCSQKLIESIHESSQVSIEAESTSVTILGYYGITCEVVEGVLLDVPYRIYHFYFPQKIIKMIQRHSTCV